MLFSSCRFSTILLLAGITFFSNVIIAKPFAVKTDIQIKTDDWFPLTVENMKAAAADTALAELSKGGLFTLDGKNTVNDSLRLEISLIGPAETAKLTIHANLTGQPTYVSTASISLSNMDYQGIYKAFEHIGTTAAQRMNDKIEALAVSSLKPTVTTGGLDNEKLRAEYDKAQGLKRKYQYKQARIIFEQLSASSLKDAVKIIELAKDELRYGLPVFEAKQQTVAIGSALGDVGIMGKAISRAENLYRQILAENRTNLERTIEAQKALDDLLVTANAIKASVKAQSMSTAYNLSRMIKSQMTRSQMMLSLGMNDKSSGGCPDRSALETMIATMATPLKLKNVSEQDKAIIYTLHDERSDYNFSLSCLNDQVTVINN